MCVCVFCVCACACVRARVWTQHHRIFSVTACVNNIKYMYFTACVNNIKYMYFKLSCPRLILRIRREVIYL